MFPTVSSSKFGENSSILGSNPLLYTCFVLCRSSIEFVDGFLGREVTTEDQGSLADLIHCYVSFYLFVSLYTTLLIQSNLFIPVSCD